MAKALTKLGVNRGDRVATLAMNHVHHLTSWYGAVGMGGILHTINPRLFPDQLAYIANHAEDRVLIYDKAFAQFDFGYASTLSVAMLIILVIVTYFQYRLTRAGQSDLN